MDSPSWSDIYTPEELAVALEHHAAQTAKRTGLYHVADELKHAAACIRELDQRLETVVAIGDALRDEVLSIRRTMRANIESLGRKPS